MSVEKRLLSRNDRIFETLDITDAGEWAGKAVFDYPLAIVRNLFRFFPFVVPAWLVDRYAYQYGFYRSGTWPYFGLVLASLPWFVWRVRKALRQLPITDEQVIT